MTANDGSYRSIALELVSNGIEKFCLSTETQKSIGEAWTSYWLRLDCQKSLFYSMFSPNYVFLTEHIPFNRARNGLNWKRKILSVYRDQEIYWRSMDELLLKARLPEIFFLFGVSTKLRVSD